MMRTKPNRARVVIVGVGFGGMQVARSLSRSDVNVVPIDRHNYNTFVPLLYQVAIGQIEPESIAYPIRTTLRRARRTRFLQAEVERIDFEGQIVETDGPSIPYDYLVLATGSQARFLNVPGAAENAFALETLEQAVALRNHIFSCFERAAQEGDPVRRRHLLTFAIVGGGPTGVEVAGALVELQRVLGRDYPGLDLQEVRIILVQSGDRLLAHLPKRLGHYTTRRLRKLGVSVRLQTRVSHVAAGTVAFHDGACLHADTIVWTAGLEAAPPELPAAPAATRRQQLRVRPTLQLLAYDNVYAVGDLARIEWEGKPLAGVAPEALQQGVAVARNIRRQLRGKDPRPFRYFNKGRLAIIGRYSGVGKVGPLLLFGFLPWLMWLSVHVAYLPGFRNRLLVLLSWLHAYGWGDRAVRLILFGSPRPQPRAEAGRPLPSQDC